MRRALIAAVLLALAALAAGCGSGSGKAGSSNGADVAPSSTAVFLRIRTEPGTRGRQLLAPTLRLLPIGGTPLLPDLDAFAEALGPETDAVALDAGDLESGKVLGLTRSARPAQLRTLLAKHKPPLVSEEVAGWQVVAADRKTIDRFKRARNAGTLASNDSYQDAVEGLPEEGLATFYANGGAVTTLVDRRLKTGLGPLPGVGRVSWLAASLTRAERGLQAQLRLKGDEIEPVEYAAELPAQIPAPVSFFADAKGLDATLDELRRSTVLTGRAAAIAKALGGLLDDVIDLFEGEAAFYVRPLPRGPEYTLVLRVGDEAAAEGTLDRLATLASAYFQTVPSHLLVQGVPVTKLGLGKTTVYYAVFDGKAVITSARSGVRGLVTAGPTLSGTQGWMSAAAEAGLPEQTAGIVYADVPKALPLLERLRGRSGPPLGSLPFTTGLAYLSVDGSVLSLKGFLGVR